MLHDFLTENRTEILQRTQALVEQRAAPKPTYAELNVGIPLFFAELVTILSRSDEPRGEINRDAATHGERRQAMGFTVAQLVHDYGGLCQVITQLAIERQAPITTEEFKTLNGCLDEAIAQAVTEYSRIRERSMLDEEVQRLGFLAHELRNSLQAASIAYDILRTGTVAIGGSTGAVLGRSLASLRALVDRTLAQVRLDAGVHHKERVGVAAFLEEIEATASMLAKERSQSLSVDRGEIGVAVDADPQLLGSAVSNLVHNAIKFTHTHGHVLLRTSATADRVVIEVEDECGGLLEEQQIDELFEGFHQTGSDKSGLGLGLLISKRSVEAMGGSVRAQNMPHVGCVFTIELPRSGSSDHKRRLTDVT